MNKICKKCGIEKDVNRSVCKSCDAEYQRKKYNNYITLNVSKICNKCNQEKDIKDFVKMRNYCKDCRNLYDKKYDYKEKHKMYYQNDKANYKEKARMYRKNNKEKLKEYLKKYDLEYQNKRYKNDLLFRISKLIRSSINQALKRSGYVKESRTHYILGCSYEDFKIYLESKFEPWMNWENQGLYDGNFNTGWDIDHIEPLFPEGIIRTEEDILRLNHYTNLQPLCSKINRDIKKNK